MSNSLKQSTALIIDDFQNMRSMLLGFLRSMGMTNVDSVGTASEALALLAKKKYDIVICDYNLGQGKNGQQILEEAKHKNYIGYATIWVMVTAEKTMDMFMGAAETKPDDYMLKPISSGLLEARLNKLIEKKLSLESIEKAIKINDITLAIFLCDEQLKERSSNTQEILRIKSDLLMRAGDFAVAKSFFENILATRSVPWAKTGLGRVYFITKDYSRARDMFLEVLDENKMYLEAADWLSKTYDALGDLEQAQNVLTNAMALSPNASARQKNHADAAYKNGALDLALVSYEKAIKLGEHSVHKSSGTYAGLAKVLTSAGNPEEALKVLGRSKVEFKNDPDAALQAAVLEGMAYQKMGQPEKAAEALAIADGLMRNKPDQLDSTTAMEMADVLLKLGQKDKALGLLESVVKNNHGNTGVISLVEAVFETAGIGDEGDALIKKSAQEVLDINRQGVVLANEGKLQEGIDLLRTALKVLPDNDLMIMNLCGMMIGLMSRNGRDYSMPLEARASI